MKRARTAIIGLFSMATILSAPFIWAFWPGITGWIEMNSAVRAIQKFDIKGEHPQEMTYGVNTFTNECRSGSIKSYYDQAARALSEKSDAVKTYFWKDTIGWERVSTVLQFESGFIEIRVSQNNDNDSIFVKYFPDELFYRGGAEELEGIKLPKGTLQDD